MSQVSRHTGAKRALLTDNAALDAAILTELREHPDQRSAWVTIGIGLDDFTGKNARRVAGRLRSLERRGLVSGHWNNGYRETTYVVNQ